MLAKERNVDVILPVRTYQVQNEASRTDTRAVVLSTPAGNKKESGLPRAPEGRDRARTSANVSGRAFRVGEFGGPPKSARTKRKVEKSTKISQTYAFMSFGT